MTRASALILALFPAFMAAPAAADIYRWVDERGITHFGEKPPAHQNASPLDIRAQRPSSDIAGAQARREAAQADWKADQDGAKAAEEAAKKAAEEASRREELTRACDTHRNNLKTLTSSTRIKETSPDGDVAYLDDTQRKARIASTEAFIRENCP